MADNDTPRGGQGFPAENRDGSPALIGPDEYTRHLAIERANRGQTTVVGGNIADLQRIGEQVVGGPGTTTASKAIPAPPGVDPSDENVKTAGQAEADRGEWTRETERAGLRDAPPAPEPPENTEPNVVDPGNTSPEVQVKGSASTTRASGSASATTSTKS